MGDRPALSSAGAGGSETVSGTSAGEQFGCASPEQGVQLVCTADFIAVKCL